MQGIKVYKPYLSTERRKIIQKSIFKDKDLHNSKIFIIFALEIGS